MWIAGITGRHTLLRWSPRRAASALAVTDRVRRGARRVLKASGRRGDNRSCRVDRCGYARRAFHIIPTRSPVPSTSSVDGGPAIHMRRRLSTVDIPARWTERRAHRALLHIHPHIARLIHGLTHSVVHGGMGGSGAWRRAGYTHKRPLVHRFGGFIHAGTGIGYAV